MHTPNFERETIFEKQFTRFMVVVIRNARNGYFRKRSRSKLREILLSEIPEHMHPCADDIDSLLSLLNYNDYLDSLQTQRYFSL